MNQENKTIKSLFECLSKPHVMVGSPKTNIWEYIIMPSIIGIFAVISCAIFGLWYIRRKRQIQSSKSESKSIKSQTNDTKNALKDKFRSKIKNRR